VVKASWLEVSLHVSDELAEAVAEVLGRFTQEGVVIEQTVRQNNRKEKEILNPTVKVYGYLFADAAIEDRKHQVQEALWHLGQIMPLPEADFREVQDENWMAAWKDQYQPIQVGQNLLIVPAWIEAEYPGRIPIRINPGMAFGTGTHPTTQLCLSLIEDYLQPGMIAFDIGCGSGILSIAAAKLGAERVVAVDIDPASVQSTQENSALNQVENRLNIAQGSVAGIRGGAFGAMQAPFVIANILSSVILGLFRDGLAELVAPHGLLVLSGILDHQAEEIIHTAGNAGLILVVKRVMEDWVALCLQNEAGV
jgi:ribosomal protein L11 methyltransferase